MKAHILKAGDLKPLSDIQLVVMAARMAARVAPWCPVGGEHSWQVAMEDLLKACCGEALSASVAASHARAISTHGAMGSYSAAPEAMWRSRNQAACTLSLALQSTQLAARKDRWRRVVGAGKHAVSVFVVQAHAGVMPISEAIAVPWAAARSDVALIVEHPVPATLAELQAIGPLWPDVQPSWARP